MKNLFYIFTALSLIVLSSETIPERAEDNLKVELYSKLLKEQKKPTCPKNHQDSIVPIVYGYPSEELWAKSDSGLVAIGGCEVGPEENFCKIHKIRF